MQLKDYLREFDYDEDEVLTLEEAENKYFGSGIPMVAGGLILSDQEILDIRQFAYEVYWGSEVDWTPTEKHLADGILKFYNMLWVTKLQKESGNIV